MGCVTFASSVKSSNECYGIYLNLRSNAVVVMWMLVLLFVHSLKLFSSPKRLALDTEVACTAFSTLNTVNIKTSPSSLSESPPSSFPILVAQGTDRRSV